MDRSQIPGPQKPRSFNFPVYEEFKLPNGLQVVFAPHGKLPVIAMQLVLHSGANFDNDGKEGLSSIVTDLLAEGTKKRSSYEISQAFENIGTQFSTHSDWNASYLELIAIKKQLSTSMDIFNDVLYNSAFFPKELKRLKKQLLSQRMRVTDSGSRMAQEKLYQIIFEQTRYAIPIGGRSSQIKNLNRDDIVNFYETFYSSGNATLIIVGDLTRREVQKITEDHFSEWKPKDITSENQNDFREPDSQKIHLVHKSGAQQAEIRIGHLGIDRLNPDYFKTVLLNQILGGYFMSRLNQNLREDKGFTYGISSRFVTRKVRGPFMVSSAVDSMNVEKAISEIMKEIRRIQNELISEQELSEAKGYLSGIFPIAFESGAQIAAGLSNIVVFNLEKNYYRNYRENVDAISKEDILDAAQKYLQPDKASIVVCADKKDIIPQLKDYDVSVSKFDSI